MGWHPRTYAELYAMRDTVMLVVTVAWALLLAYEGWRLWRRRR